MRRNFPVIAAVCLSVIAIVIFFTKSQKSPAEPAIDDPASLNEVPVIVVQPRMEYGILVDSFRIEEGVVRRNQNLSHILSAHNISNQVIHQIANAPRELFDARRIRAGNPYKLFYAKDDSPVPSYFVYKPDAVRFVKINLNDSVVIERGAREVRQELKSASGQINSSLWNALDRQPGPAGSGNRTLGGVPVEH
jgi:hypothetical protein